MGTLTDRVHRELTDADIARIAGTYHAWRGDKDAGEYADVPGFCKAAKLEDIRKHGMCSRPAGTLGPKLSRTTASPSRRRCPARGHASPAADRSCADLDAAIAANLKELGYGE
jgi:type I restriction enzyme M protein